MCILSWQQLKGPPTSQRSSGTKTEVVPSSVLISQAKMHHGISGALNATADDAA